MPELTLYYRKMCPFCRKVLQFMEESNVTVPLTEITEKSEYQEELTRLGGKSQVPCLMIDGKALYESDGIIQWFKEEKIIIEKNRH